MKISGQIKNIHIPPSARWDILFLPALFLFNCFTFSSWWPLSKFATNPWSSLAWLYGLVMLVPLVWRDKAPLTVFATQCVLTVTAWPFFDLYTPITGVPVALYAVSVRYSKRISLPALLVSLIPNGLAAAVAFKVDYTFEEEIRSFIQNSIFLVLLVGVAWALGRGTQASKRRVQFLENKQKTAQAAVIRGTEKNRRRAPRHRLPRGDFNDLASRRSSPGRQNRLGRGHPSTDEYRVQRHPGNGRVTTPTRGPARRGPH